MKKLLTLVVILLFASNFFAQEEIKSLKDQQVQTEKAIKAGEIDARGMNHLLFNKKKELGKLADQTQIPHGPQNNDVVVYSENFEELPGFQVVNHRTDAGVGDTTTFNAFKGEGGEYSWWIGSNDPSFLQPGYGHNWRVALETSGAFQVQSSLTTAVVEFDAFYNLEEGWDGVHLQVASASSAAGPFTNWAYVSCYTGDTGGQWLENVQVDISSYISSPAKWVKFRFVLVSESSYDSQDGEVGGFNNPGGFFFDNLKLRRNNVPELISDGGDNKYEFLPSYIVGPNTAWALTGAKFSSADTSMGHRSYQPGEYQSFRVSGPPADLSVAALGGNDVAPLWFDFKVFSNIPYDANAPGGAFTYWRPYARVTGHPVLPTGNYFLTSSVYVGPFRNGDAMVNYSDNFGYIDVTAFIGAPDVRFGIMYFSNGGCTFDAGQLYFDDFKVIQKNDPYEWNDYCDTATLVEYGFVSEFANIWDASDVDYFYFEGEAGDWVDIYVDNSQIDAMVSLLPQVGPFNSVIDNSSCGSPMVAGAPCCELWSYHDGYFYDRVIWRLPYTGGYFIEVYGFGDTGGYVMYVDQLTATAEIASIADVPGDQGKNVKIQFSAPQLDTKDDADFDFWGADVDFYQVERRKNPISNDWEYVRDVLASGKAGSTYTVEANTVFDSTSTTFRIRTVGGNEDRQGEFVTVSANALGQSYDNIAPRFDAEYTAAAQSGTGIDVGAEVDYGGGNNGVSDIRFYNIYRGTEAGFTPAAANMIATLETSALSIRYNDQDYDGNDEFYYVIQVVDDGGNKVYSKEVNTTTNVTDEAVPTVYSLSQNYPNPFNPSTTIKFGIPQAADVTVKIYDILGQEVKTLMNRNLAAGFHTVNFDASNLISGMYIYRIQANGVDGSNFTDVKKMLLVK
ncbi:MAG: T9SS type A sorting domain-containing protein [Melioribacteraceae bacterium]|nr:T9SS type A sorting domain-containing protein [Melioribacteraceae bacterium]